MKTTLLFVPRVTLKMLCIASVFVSVLLLHNTAQAQRIIQPSVAAYSSQDPYGISRPAVATVDGSGLTVGPSLIPGAADSMHYSTADVEMWTTAGITAQPNDIEPFITYDLGDVFDLQALRVWNYNEAGFTHIGASSIRLSTSVDGTNFSPHTTVEIAQATGGPAELPQDFAVAATGIRYVRLQILTNWDGAVFWSSITGTNDPGPDGRALTGLSEVRLVVAGNVAPVIVEHPRPVTLPTGASASFTVNATDAGFPPLSYRWRRNGTNLVDGGSISGSAASELVVNPIAALDEANYDVVVRNAQTSVTSHVARLLIGADLITPTVAAFSSQTATRSVINLVNGSGMSGAGYFADTHDNVAANSWYRASQVTDLNPFIIFDLGSFYDLKITRIWNYNTAAKGNYTTDARISTSQDGVTFASWGIISLAPPGGTVTEPAQDFATPASLVRFVKLEPLTGPGWRGLSEVRFEGKAAATSLPLITAQPARVARAVGGVVTLSVTADPNGFPPLRYRWQKGGVNLSDGGNISGATTANLTVANLTVTDTGSYAVVVSNTVAGLSSMPASVVVVPPPQVTIDLRRGGTLITPKLVAFSSEYNGGGYIRLATNLVSGAGMSGPGYYTDTHGNTHDTVWHRASTTADPDPYVTFDLGGSCDLLITRIWNLNQSGATGNGAKDVRVSVSADNASFAILGTNTLREASGTTNDPPQDLSTPATGIRYVKLEPLSGYGGGWNGLAAVRFIVAGPEQPTLLSAVLEGLPGFHYQIQSVSELGGTNGWSILDIPSLRGTPFVLPAFDGAAPASSGQQYYRGIVILP